MLNKYIQLTATGPVAAKNNLCFEYNNATKYGYYEYVHCTANWSKYYLYQNVSTNALVVFNTNFAQATSTPTAHGGYLSVQRYPDIYFDPAVHSDTYGASVWNPGTISLSETTYTGTFTVSTTGNYLIHISGTCGSIKLAFSTSGTSYTILTQNIYGDNSGLIYSPIYLMSGKYQIVINPNDNDEINIASGNAWIKLMPQNLVVDNHMLPYLSRNLFNDSDSENSTFYNKPASWASPAKILETSWTPVPYQNCTAGSLNGKFGDVRQNTSITLASNQLSSIKNYYCCAHRIRVWMPIYSSEKYVRLIRITDPVTQLGNEIKFNRSDDEKLALYYYYDLPGVLAEFWYPCIPSLVSSSLRIEEIAVADGDPSSGSAIIVSKTPTEFTNNTTAYKQTSLLLCKPGSNQYVIDSCSVYQIGQLTKNVAMCTSVYFAIEMAVKLSNGRTVRIRPLGGEIYFFANGTFFYSNAVNGSNWTTYTSADDSTRQVYRWTGISAKSLMYVNGFHISSGGYINITGTYTTVYGSSGSSSGATYAGKYTIGTTTTASGYTFTTTVLSDPGNKRVGFKILSGF